jgi:hypothetical protein
MSDVLSGARSLAEFRGLIACGGFSYGDVLGAGEGWAKSILFHDAARRQFSDYFARRPPVRPILCGRSVGSRSRACSPQVEAESSRMASARGQPAPVVATTCSMADAMLSQRLPLVTA